MRARSVLDVGRTSRHIMSLVSSFAVALTLFKFGVAHVEADRARVSPPTS